MSAPPSESGVELPAGVAGTGYRIAHSRAEESKRDDRLFDDPFASAFVGAGPGIGIELAVEEHSAAQIDALIAFGMVTEFSFVVRTRFFDDYLLAAAPTCRQVVIAAAGLDARALRLAWPPDTRVFEVDLPEVFAFKEAVIDRLGTSPSCEWTVVAADLARDWPSALLAAGFDRTQPTAWLAEGLMLYLTSEEAGGLVDKISELSAPASQLAFEHGLYADHELTSSAADTPALAPAASTWRGGLADDPVALLGRRGWRAVMDDIVTVGAALGREAPAHAVLQLVTALRE